MIIKDEPMDEEEENLYTDEELEEEYADEPFKEPESPDLNSSNPEYASSPLSSPVKYSDGIEDSQPIVSPLPSVLPHSVPSHNLNDIETKSQTVKKSTITKKSTSVTASSKVIESKSEIDNSPGVPQIKSLSKRRSSNNTNTSAHPSNAESTLRPRKAVSQNTKTDPSQHVKNTKKRKSAASSKSSKKSKSGLEDVTDQYTEVDDDNQVLCGICASWDPPEENGGGGGSTTEWIGCDCER